ncbi:aminotransferase class IV [Flavobacteriaceae bacterium]|jgi:branched-chain amino acid aminotransferase|nr:aminotransferase class IV [Flavobacteriaceae bacterium]MDC1168326.1 aminotransferase class IV [Flavobacteriaceae bacterium]MDC3227461.1 aminotransferase class IV [bacterium]
MLNYNGNLVAFEDVKITPDNRAYKYGDSVFETIKVINGKLVFWEEHYFRLMASMRMLRMKIPMNFTLEFLEKEILKTVKVTNSNTTLRIRLTITRKDGGFYLPLTNEVDYLIEYREIRFITKDNYKVDLFKDFYLYSGHLSTIKTNNKLIHTLASIFAKENDLDNCILLNERKGIVEATNATLFLIKGNTIKTPLLSEGCLKGIAREKVINIIESNNDYDIEETVISPFEIQKADEVFITNSIIGIQPITNYRKKAFSTDISKKLAMSLNVLELTSK